MKVVQSLWTRSKGWNGSAAAALPDAQLVLAFGACGLLAPARLRELRARFPKARLAGCTTAGEILGDRVHDGTLAVTAVRFGSARVRCEAEPLSGAADSFGAGRRLGARLRSPGLVHVFVLSDGLDINGSELVRGLAAPLPASVSVTGGLSGDGSRFRRTEVLLDARPRPGLVAAVGFYGRLKVGFGSLGGWDPFGPERLITRSRGNVLYELDGRPALELYKLYLGAYARRLPASGLLFPLALRGADGRAGVVRTILGVDERRQAMTFAGDVPQGAYARLMKANFERLIDGAAGAARTSRAALGRTPPELALLVSCVGRKLVLKQRVEDELEGVRRVVGPGAALAGFYSYGEISPFSPSAPCELHNQTMTITTLSEA